MVLSKDIECVQKIENFHIFNALIEIKIVATLLYFIVRV